MSLSKLSAGGIFQASLNTPMTRREFLKMSGALILTLFGVQSLLNVFKKYTGNTSATSLLTTGGDGFGTRKFGE